MKNDIRLYLSGKEVDFTKTPDILFNYTINDLSNPTAVKNSYSKTITIEGTKTNNDIFGHIYDLTRVQNFGNVNYNGVDFNPLEKADFQLFCNGELYESGYFKLTEIRKNHNIIEYDITLYGGLGDFFYNLTYKGGDSDNGSDKLEVADLFGDSDLDFTINKDTVSEAWRYVHNNDADTGFNKWRYINFAPCYNGIPKDFKADTIYTDRITIPANGSTVAKTLSNSFMTASQDLTEWETKDLRSYLQRPVLRVQKVIEEMCKPEKNGGYEVDLDGEFFNKNNPYWRDSWVTLKMLRDLDIQKENTVSTTATLGSGNNNIYPVNTSQGSYIGYTNASIKMHVEFKATGTTTANTLFTTYKYQSDGGFTLQSRFVKEVKRSYAVDLQMLAYDASDTLVAYSNVVHLCSDPKSTGVPANFKDLGSSFPKPYDGGTTLYGTFEKRGDKFVWCNAMGNPEDIEFKFNSDAPFNHFAFRIMCPAYYYQKYTGSGGYTEYSRGNTYASYLYTTQKYVSSRWEELSSALSHSQVGGSFKFSITEASLTQKIYEGFFSGTKIKGKDLLTLGVTPCDFLLSYCKMFGLYFMKDIESKTIHIMSRNSFYHVNDVVDLEKIIDRGKTMTIIPQVAATKWYDFSLEPVDSQANSDYNYRNGMDYGIQRVNTNYNFDSERTEMFENNCFKSGISVLEKSAFYRKAYKNTGTVLSDCQPYVFLGMTYDNSGTDTTVRRDITTGYLNTDNRLEGYDTFPKLQFHTESNEASDGDMVLVFAVRDNNNIEGYYNKSLQDTYYLSDDIGRMLEQDSSACWLSTKDTTLVTPVTAVPNFSRMIIREDNQYILHSWDMGKTVETFVPYTYNTEGMSIYDAAWKNYISDLYSVNNRSLKCYCLLETKPNPDWLRKLYWFDNSYWRLNRIVDWNISSYDTTAIEFVKVINRYNYQLLPIKNDSPYMDISLKEIEPDKRYINVYEGSRNEDETIREYVVTGLRDTSYTMSLWSQDGDGLFIVSDDLPDWITTTPAWDSFGSINQSYTITVHENTGAAREFEFKVTDELGRYATLILKQSAGAWLEVNPKKAVMNFRMGSTGVINLEYHNMPSDEVVTFDHNEQNDWWQGVITWDRTEGEITYGRLTYNSTEPNLTDFERIDYIKFESGGHYFDSFSIPVSQQAQRLIIH